MSDDLVGLVRGGFEAASRGDVDAIAGMLAPDVRWHGAGDGTGGCQNRKQALHWMREAIERGVAVELLDARELPGDRVALVLRRRPSSDDPEPPPPHGEIISFRDGLTTAMVVYPTVEEALAAAG
jgi:ketosteroid isomerase-like protein